MPFRYNALTNNLDLTDEGGGGSSVTLTGSTGGALSPTDGNFNIVAGGNAGQTVVFDGSGSTLSLNLADGQDNIFLGRVAGSGYGGPANVGVGTGTFQHIYDGQWNTAVGFVGLNSLVSGTQNTAIGYSALAQVVSGGSNTAVGSLCLSSCTGSYNVGVGWQTLQNLVGGNANVVIGHTSGYNYNGSESNNILISNIGVAGESGKIRIGNADSNACFVAGVNGVAVANSEMVTCDSNGQLGTAPQGYKLIQTQTVSNVATIDFISGFGSYNNLFISYSLGPETDNTAIAMKQSSDGGSTWEGLFSWGLNYSTIVSTTLTNVSNNNSTPMQFTAPCASFGYDQSSGFVNIRNFQLGFHLSVCFDSNFDADGFWNRAIGYANGDPNVNALRFLATSGNISGTISIYGLNS